MKNLALDLLSIFRLILLPSAQSVRFAASHGARRAVAASIWLWAAAAAAYSFAHIRYGFPVRIPSTVLLLLGSPMAALFWAWLVATFARQPYPDSKPVFLKLFFVHSMALVGIIVARLPVSRIPIMGSLLSKSLYLYLGLILIIATRSITGLGVLRSIGTSILASILSVLGSSVVGYLISKIPDLAAIKRPL
jgi:hypothetical protein